MKKLIHTSLVLLALTSTASHANPFSEYAEAESKLSYACKTMLERGSMMFCDDKALANTYAKAKAEITELAYISSGSSGSYACNTMLEQGSEMFCQKERAETFSQISTN